MIRALTVFLILIVSICIAGEELQLASKYYDSEEFFEYLGTFAKEKQNELLDKMYSSFSNDAFHVADGFGLWLFLHNSRPFSKSNIETINKLFHTASDFQNFDYTDLNQFEIRKLKKVHSEWETPVITDGTIFYTEHDYQGSRLGEFNFEHNFFEMGVESIQDEYVQIYKHIDSKTVPTNYGGNSYAASIEFTNNPEKIKIIFDDIQKPERFSQGKFKIKKIFKLTGIVKQFDDYKDMPTNMMEAYKQTLNIIGVSTGNWEKLESFNAKSINEKAKEFNQYCAQKNLPNYHSFSRTHFHSFEADLLGVIIESPDIGTQIWKAPGWHNGFAYGQESKLFLKSVSDEELKKFSALAWAVAKILDEYFPRFMYASSTSQNANPNLPESITSCISRINKEIEVLEKTQYRIKKLDSLSYQYQLGLTKLRSKLNEYKVAFKEDNIGAYTGLFDPKVNPKYANDEKLRNKFLSSYYNVWVNVNNEYIYPAEISFASYLRDNYPDRMNLALPYTRCIDIPSVNTGISLYDSKEKPTIRALFDPIYGRSKVYADISIRLFVDTYICAINGVEIQTTCDYYRELMKYSTGDKIEFTYLSPDYDGRVRCLVIAK